jgi:hypothetical protein
MARKIITSKEITTIEKMPESYVWQLAEYFRQRSDQSSNFLRALLLAITSGSLLFLISKHYDDPNLNLHWVSIALLLCAIVLLIWSWDRQKTKSIGRLIKLRDEGYRGYLKYEDWISESYRNETIDRFAYAAIASGVATEILIKVVPLICKLAKMP